MSPHTSSRRNIAVVVVAAGGVVVAKSPFCATPAHCSESVFAFG